MKKQQSQDEQVNPISVLVDELKNDNIVERLASIKRLNTISIALGEQRTREELVPFLSQSITEDDEVLMAIAEELGKLVPMVGGPQYAYLLLTPLEQLCIVEETVVREKAVESLNNVASQMNKEVVVQYVVPLVKRLASDEWFTARVSACGLFAVAYQKSSGTIRKELKDAFITLSGDEAPMVRRAAAQGFGPLVKVAESDIVRSNFLDSFTHLVQDEQDSVRQFSVDSCAPLALVLSNRDAKTSLVPLIQGLVQDESWRVRSTVTQQFVNICKNLGEEITRYQLASYFAKLLQDVETEVRIISTSQVAEFGILLDYESTMTFIIPCVKQLAQDSSQSVRSSLAMIVMELAPILGQKGTIEQLIPVFLQLLRDASAEVRLNIINKLQNVNAVVGVDVLSESLLPALEELSRDSNWRVRMAVLQKMSMLAKQFGGKIFEQKAETFQLTNWLDDQVATIRDSAANELRKVTEVLGSKWAQDNLLPRLGDKLKHPNYLNRISILRAYASLIRVMPKDSIKSQLLPTLLKCVDDGVPNVRFNVTKLLIQIHEFLEKDWLNGIVKNSLQKLTEDSDRDVQYFAQEALEIVCSSGG